MSRLLVLCVALAVVCSAASSPLFPHGPGPVLLNEDQVTPKDVGLLFEGILAGLVEDVGNITACVGDGEAAFNDFETALTDLKTGFADKDTKAIFAAFKQIGAGVNEFKAALVACGISKLASELTSVVTELEQPEGWIKIVVQEAVTIFKNLKEITADCHQASDDWAAQNYEGAGEAIGRIIGLFL
eukprot:Opistho-1_new@5372